MLHGPVHKALLSPVAEPYNPALQNVHDPAPSKLYDPVGHIDAVGDVEPAGQLYPAVHGPEQVAAVKPVIEP
jgi:hypothetical protein